MCILLTITTELWCDLRNWVFQIWWSDGVIVTWPLSLESFDLFDELVVVLGESLRLVEFLRGIWIDKEIIQTWCLEDTLQDWVPKNCIIIKTYIKQVFPIFLNPGGGPVAPLPFDYKELDIILLLIDDNLFKAALLLESYYEKPRCMIGLF